ncbi:hypothetical protein HMI54_003225 [Coelomomyces lativittatus]|nr:hypothetical protein HMI56_001529 [Coelomomyces lativittatus]KAJ1508451.1 hypothetical protein HMI54_003225 [Coelomomyces lativittatus]
MILIIPLIPQIGIFFVLSPTEYPLAGDFDEMTLLGQLPRTYKSIYFVEPYFAFQRPKVSFTASKTDSSHALKDLFSHLLPWG